MNEEIELPSGKVITVPEGGTDEQVKNFAIEQGLAVEADFMLPQGAKDDSALKQGAEKSFSPANMLGEFAAGTNEAVLQLVDFLGPDQFNAASQLFGSDLRVPTLAESDFGRSVGGGGFVPEGTGQKALRGAGAVVPAAVGGGAALRQIAQNVAPTVSAVESTIPALLRQMGSSTAVADAGFGAASGAGAEVGREGGGDTGALAGSFLAPIGAIGLKSAFDAGVRGIKSLMASVSSLSDDGAATVLANIMIREGISPEEAATKLLKLGPEGMPADLGVGFSRLLRAASNKIPRIEGLAATKLKDRQAGQSGRIEDSLDDATGTPMLSVDDEIMRLNSVEGPRVTQLYNEAREQPMAFSEKLTALINGNNSVGRANKAAQARLADKKAAGDVVGDIDMIDAIKQELDDQIGVALRSGEKNKMRDLVRLKNIMIDEADAAVPKYKEARDAFAGKAQLENAADAGAEFFKMKPRDVEAFVQSMGESEKRMFRLGAKQALTDKLDAKNINRDAVAALFSKGGDVRKLKALFDDDEKFKVFSETLEREANFILTRRAAQANSQTAKQLFDDDTFANAMNDSAALLGDPIASANALQRIFTGIKSRKNGKANIDALEKAGDILLQSGMQPNKLEALLRRGSSEQISRALDNAIKKGATAKVIQPVTFAAASRESNSDRRKGNQQ